MEAFGWVVSYRCEWIFMMLLPVSAGVYRIFHKHRTHWALGAWNNWNDSTMRSAPSITDAVHTQNILTHRIHHNSMYSNIHSHFILAFSFQLGHFPIFPYRSFSHIGSISNGDLLPVSINASHVTMASHGARSTNFLVRIVGMRIQPIKQDIYGTELSRKKKTQSKCNDLHYHRVCLP